jgi:ubiquinone/menaquinone biosynthesis C-methylase UbiE
MDAPDYALATRSSPAYGSSRLTHAFEGNWRGAMALIRDVARAISGALMPTIQPRNPVSLSMSGHPMPGQAVGTERRAPWSSFRGVVTTPSCSNADIRSFFDQCASTGSPEQHGDPQRLLEYRLALLRNLARPRPTDVVLDVGCGTGHHLLALGPEVCRGIGIDVSPGMIELARTRLRNSPSGANLTFKVDDAEELKGVADQSIDLAICIGAFEHMLDKRAVLASIYRVLKFGGRFFCLAPHANYIWYRKIAPLLGCATKHLSSDRLLTQSQFSLLLDQAGFRRIRSAPWTFIPKGDVPAFIASLLTVLDLIGRHTRLNSLRGGLALCAWKEAESTKQREEVRHENGYPSAYGSR